MANLKKALYILIAIVVLGLAGWVVEKNYSFIFSRHVSGVIVDVQRVNSSLAVLGAGSTQATADSAMFSFAVAIRDESGTIHTASSEDRQWAVAKPGFCADAQFYPYPPWDLQSAGTYQNARLLHLRDCPPGTSGAAAPGAASNAAASGGSVVGTVTAPAAPVSGSTPVAQPLAQPANSATGQPAK